MNHTDLTPMQCLKCAYPLQARHVNCPNCGMAVAATQTEAPETTQAKSENERPTIRFNAEAETEGAHDSTAAENRGDGAKTMIYHAAEADDVSAGSSLHHDAPQGKDNIPAFADDIDLPVIEENIPGSAAPACRLESREGSISFSGPDAVIGRNNLPGAPAAVQAADHAKLEYRNGQWYLRDTSESGYTFIRPKDNVPLNDGDVIILGNRYFVFRDKMPD